MGKRAVDEIQGDSRVELREQEPGYHRLTIRDPMFGMVSSNLSPDAVLALHRALAKFCAPQVVQFEERAGAADALEIRRDPPVES